MLFVFKASPNLLAAGAALLSLLCVPMTFGAEPTAPHSGHAAPVEAQYRGCEAAGWCRFWIESPHLPSQSLYRVRPDGVVPTRGDNAISIAVRDRLNALLASMIHQSKHIVLHDLRELDDGTFAATVTVNGATVASDPILLELHEKLTCTGRLRNESPAGDAAGSPGWEEVSRRDGTSLTYCFVMVQTTADFGVV
jgi:hypothetical protein